MRRLGDLDSNCLVAARPYCNGRATASDKVLKRSKPVVCAVEEKMTYERKASVVGFQCPDSGTTAKRKSQIPKPKLQTNFKFQISNKAPQRIWILVLGICLGFGTWDLGSPPTASAATSAAEVALHIPAPRDSPGSTNHHALPQFGGSTRDRSPIRRVSS